MENSEILLRRSFRRQLFRSGVSLVFAAGCASGESELASRRAAAPPEEVAPDGFVDGSDPGAAELGPSAELEPVEDNAVVGIEPSHGPFSGGQLAVIRGNGFSSQVRVWFGELEVPADQLTSTRADRVQVTVPAGVPGSVSVSTQNGDDAATRRVLEGAYRYDAFYVDPESGPTSGGAVVTLRGLGTLWDESTSVRIDQQPCEVVALRGAPGGPQELDCRAPAGSEGRKTVSITSGSGAVETVLGGFIYEPGTALVGGLSGAPLAGRLDVHVSAPGGSPVAGAYVVLGSDVDVTQLGQPGAALQATDAAGDAVFEGSWGAELIVTIAARCFQPQSFVGVPVDHVRVELSPVASPDCADGQPQFFGGAPSQPVIIQGELVWRGGAEFQRAEWTNVPAAQRADERRAAYVFQPSSDPEARFRLPREGDAITLDSPGRTGYQFQVVTGAGSRTFYALAGVENRAENPPRFTAYAMGLLRGLYANPGDTLDGIAIAMDRTIDQGLRFDIVGPTPGARGPDRVEVRAAVQVAGEGYAILPNAQIEAPVAGASGQVLIGLPALLGDLEGSQYAVGARAFTGASRAAPMSVLPLITAAETSQLISVGGFLPVPVLNVGADAALAWTGELGVSFTAAERAVSLVRYDIQSGSGLITWSVAAPPGATSFRLPDLSRLPEGGLLPGAIDVSVSLASLPDFDYAALSSEDLSRTSWEAYSTDVARARYEPFLP